MEQAKQANDGAQDDAGGSTQMARSRWEDLPLPLVGLDESMTVVIWSDGAEKLFGCLKNDAIGQRITAVLGDDAAPTKGTGAEYLSQQVTHCKTRNGLIRCLWVGTDTSIAGSSVHTLWFVGQLPEGHVDEFDTRSKRLLQTVLDNVPMILWEVDAEGVMRFQDGKALATIGLKRNHYVGVNVLTFYNDDEQFRRARAGEHMFNTIEGNDRIWDSWYTPIKDGDETRGVVVLSLDVTEQKRTEQELRLKMDLIEKQRDVIRDLAVPIIHVWDRVLAVPLTGIFDSVRANDLNEELLNEVHRTQGRFVIIDLTGVDVADTATASSIVQIVRTLELLGCMGIITGIRPAVAHAIVQLGIDLKGVRTFSLLRDGLRFCMRRHGELPDRS